MADCIFCKIIQGQIPCAKIYEDDRVLSFMDINPINAGHSLVIPKQHYDTLFQVSPEDLGHCIVVAQKVGIAAFKAVGAAGMNLLQNNYRAAGQLIDHVHFHIIPRFVEDGFITAWPGKPYPEGMMNQVLNKIKEAL